MRTQVKLGLYVATVLGTLIFGSLFLRAWRASGAPESSVAAAKVTGKAKEKARPQSSTGGTNSSAAGTNAVAAGGATNAAPAEAEGTTNAPAADSGDAQVAAGEATPEQEVVPTKTSLGPRSRGLGRIVACGLGAVVSLIGLGCLLAYDASQYTAHRATRVIFHDDPGELEDSAYEIIEKAHAGGDYLEAVRLLREFMKKNPKAAHAQIRIAEIYEKDLNNPLAAALEYEEVLKLRLEPERRGWTGIHLVNLYNRMDKPAQASAMLQKVVAECPDTPAAAKALERLAALGIEPDAAAGHAGGSDPGDDGSTSPGMPRGFKRK